DWIHPQARKDATGEDRPGVLVADPAHEVPDVVEVPSDPRQLDGPLVGTEPAEDVAGDAGHQVGMPDAVLRISDHTPVLVRLRDVRVDLPVPLPIREGHGAAQGTRRHGPGGAAFHHAPPPAPRLTSVCTAVRSALTRTF